MAESVAIDVEKYGTLNTEAPSLQRCTNRIIQKVTLERSILVTNAILELPSAVFDRLSSLHKPKYALFSMLVSFTVLALSIIDLVYKGRKARVSWKMKWLPVPWFYYPFPNSKPFGRFTDIIGLICAFSQCVFASVAYAYLNHHVNSPVNLNLWPLIFALGLLFSRFSENPESSFTHIMRKKRYRDAFVADVISSERFTETRPPLIRGLSI